MFPLARINHRFFALLSETCLHYGIKYLSYFSISLFILFLIIPHYTYLELLFAMQDSLKRDLEFHMERDSIWDRRGLYQCDLLYFVERRRFCM